MDHRTNVKASISRRLPTPGGAGTKSAIAHRWSSSGATKTAEIAVMSGASESRRVHTTRMGNNRHQAKSSRRVSLPRPTVANPVPLPFVKPGECGTFTLSDKEKRALFRDEAMAGISHGPSARSCDSGAPGRDHPRGRLPAQDGRAVPEVRPRHAGKEHAGGVSVPTVGRGWNAVGDFVHTSAQEAP